jgi:hypothetical protein
VSKVSLSTIFIFFVYYRFGVSHFWGWGLAAGWGWGILMGTIHNWGIWPGGMDYVAVGQAVSRFSQRRPKEPAWRRQIKHRKAQLSKMETWPPCLLQFFDPW